MFIPIPLTSQKGRIFFYKILWKVIMTPCIPASFLIIWMTEQLVSFNQPFQDLFYTICYVAKNDSVLCKKYTPNFGTSYILVMFLYRVIQNLKTFHQNAMSREDKKYQFTTGPFIGAIRGAMGFLSSLIALFLRLKLFENVFILWIVIASITTFYSWLVDVIGDWGLVQINTDRLFRKKLLFPKAKSVYIFCVIIDLVLRAAWVLTLTSFVADS